MENLRRGLSPHGFPLPCPRRPWTGSRMTRIVSASRLQSLPWHRFSCSRCGLLLGEIPPVRIVLEPATSDIYAVLENCRIHLCPVASSWNSPGHICLTSRIRRHGHRDDSDARGMEIGQSRSSPELYSLAIAWNRRPDHCGEP